jgi:hypothetical protein
MRYRFFSLAALALASTVAISPMVQARSTLFNGVPLEASIMRAGSTAQRIARVKSVPAVGVIKIRRDIIRPFEQPGFGYTDEIETIKLTVERNGVGVNRLRKALRDNPATREALAQHGISIRRVVAVDIGSNGALRVYVL